MPTPFLPPRVHSYGLEVEVVVHHHVDEAVEQQPDKLDAGPGLYPNPAHEDDTEVMVDVEEVVGRSFALNQLQDRVEQLVVLGKVVDEAPEPETPFDSVILVFTKQPRV